MGIDWNLQLGSKRCLAIGGGGGQMAQTRSPEIQPTKYLTYGKVGVRLPAVYIHNPRNFYNTHIISTFSTPTVLTKINKGDLQGEGRGGGVPTQFPNKKPLPVPTPPMLSDTSYANAWPSCRLKLIVTVLTASHT